MFQTQHESSRVDYPVSQLCRILQISPSHFYRWRSGWKSKRALSDELLRTRMVHGAFKAHKGRYGNRRVTEELQDEGETFGRHRVARLMRESGLRGKVRRRHCVTTDSKHSDPIAPNNVERRFDVEEPNRVWAGDVTYLRTTEGWLYLAVIHDICSRKVVGWAMSTSQKKELCLDALQMAIWRRRPAKGLIHHSDRGSQYTSGDYRKALEKASISC